MKLPKQAKSIFQLILFEVYQWEQKLYDGSSTIFEMISRKYTTDVIATMENKIVILKQSQP
jgi:hypothetical protein